MAKEKNPTFSVLMSVYKNDNPEHLKLALESIYEKQTKKPDEIVVVFDGPLTAEQLKVLDNFRDNKKKIVKYIPLKENKGLGEALRIGAEKCNSDYIFRMDADDISKEDRFEIQSNYVIKHPTIDVLGSNIEEFKLSPNENNRRIRMCPEKQTGIKNMAKKRNPMNHVTTCIKKTALIESGNYVQLKGMEDYYLWLRMIVAGKQLRNINKTLVYVRVGNGFENRRSANSQIEGWRILQRYMLDHKLITKTRSIINMAAITVFTHTPKKLKIIIYKKFLRK